MLLEKKNELNICLGRPYMGSCPLELAQEVGLDLELGGQGLCSFIGGDAQYHVDTHTLQLQEIQAEKTMTSNREMMHDCRNRIYAHYTCRKR